LFVCNIKMHIQSCTFNFLSKLESFIEFDGFYRYVWLGWVWEHKIILQRDVWSCYKLVRYFYFCLTSWIWRSFSKLESSIECSLKSFSSNFKLDNLVVIIRDVIYIFKLQFLMNIVSFFFPHFFRCILQKMKIIDLS
jgi:hypothetical protein